MNFPFLSLKKKYTKNSKNYETKKFSKQRETGHNSKTENYF